MNVTGLRPAVGAGKKIYVETYGCQMNVGDSEILVSIMQQEGYTYTEDIAAADVILLNTCSIRDNAEQRVWGRLRDLHRYKRARKGLIVGIVGCMAERLREQLLERETVVDIVAGPDSYRDMPRLVATAMSGTAGVNVQLSQEETYAEIRPVRLDRTGVSAFVSIMRGCNNFCSYCVVPYTRGRERSRDPQTILREVRELFEAGYREVTLLGQNVNSYRWQTGESMTDAVENMPLAGNKKVKTEKYVTETENAGGHDEKKMQQTIEGMMDARENMPDTETNMAEVDFPTLIDMVASTSPLLRVRFATSHPKDLSNRLLEVMVARPNICRAIHLPAQSGSSRVLDKMNRKYSREWYLDRIAAIRRLLPEAAITTDLIAGFCSETDEDHRQTLSLMREVGYDSAFMFKYSERPGTQADRTMEDDVPEEIKTARLQEIIELQNFLSEQSNRRDVGRVFEVLVEGPSRKGGSQLCGRNSQNKMVVFEGSPNISAGNYVRVKIDDCSSATLFGHIV